MSADIPQARYRPIPWTFILVVGYQNKTAYPFTPF